MWNLGAVGHITNACRFSYYLHYLIKYLTINYNSNEKAEEGMSCLRKDRRIDPVFILSNHQGPITGLDKALNRTADNQSSTKPSLSNPSNLRFSPSFFIPIIEDMSFHGFINDTLCESL